MNIIFQREGVERSLNMLKFCSMWRFLHPISQDVNKRNGNKQNLLVEHLFNEDGEGLVEFLKGNKLHHVMDKFTTLCSPNVRNLVALFKHHLNNKGYIDDIVALKFISVMITFKIIVFLDECLQKNVLLQDVYRGRW